MERNEYKAVFVTNLGEILESKHYKTKEAALSFLGRAFKTFSGTRKITRAILITFSPDESVREIQYKF